MNKQRIRDFLLTKHPDAELQAWFDPLRLRFSDACGIEISFPHALFASWFAKERQKAFEKDMAHLLGSQPRITYARAGGGRGRALKYPARSAQRSNIPVFAPGETAQWSFDTFIYNKKNEFPVSMAREMAASAQNPAYTPFIICGKGTCGKTHLLRAMAASMAASIPWEGIYLGTADELNALFTETGKTGFFRRKLMRHKAIFIDNGQDLAAHPELQQELVAIADVFHEKKKPFVLALDDVLDQTALNQKLRSRLESGLVVTVKKPDLDVRLRYAKAQCAAQRLHLKKELLLPLAQRFQNLRAIQGVVAKIAAFQKRSGKAVTAVDLDKILAASDTLSGKLATPGTIIGYVADAYSLSPEDISGNGRTASIVFARQVAMFLCRELLGVPLSSLGRYFNGKNHATVLYACKKIGKIIDSDKDTHKIITQIRKKFLSAPG